MIIKRALINSFCTYMFLGIFCIKVSIFIFNSQDNQMFKCICKLGTKRRATKYTTTRSIPLDSIALSENNRSPTMDCSSCIH